MQNKASLLPSDVTNLCLTDSLWTLESLVVVLLFFSISILDYLQDCQDLASMRAKGLIIVSL